MGARLAEIRQRAIRVIRTHRIPQLGAALHEIPELGVTMLATRASVRQWGTRAARARAFSVACIICLVGAVVVGAAAFVRPTHGPTLRGTNINPPASRSQLTTAKQPLKGTAPSAGDANLEIPRDAAHLEIPGDVEPDLSRVVQGLPPAADNPDLERALNELDQMADRDELMRQQQLVGQLPSAPAAGPPVALPDGQAPNAPPPAASTTVPAPGPTTQPHR